MANLSVRARALYVGSFVLSTLPYVCSVHDYTRSDLAHLESLFSRAVLRRSMFPGCHVAPLLSWLRIASMPVPEITLDSAALQFWARREAAVYPAVSQGRRGGRVARLLAKWSARVGHQAMRPLLRTFTLGGLLNFQRAAKAGKLFKQIAQAWVTSRMQEWPRSLTTFA